MRQQATPRTARSQLSGQDARGDDPDLYVSPSRNGAEVRWSLAECGGLQSTVWPVAFLGHQERQVVDVTQVPPDSDDASPTADHLDHNLGHARNSDLRSCRLGPTNEQFLSHILPMRAGSSKE